MNIIRLSCNKIPRGIRCLSNGIPGFSDYLKTPAAMEQAKKMMQDPEAVKKMQEMMKDPNTMSKVNEMMKDPLFKERVSDLQKEMNPFGANVPITDSMIDQAKNMMGIKDSTKVEEAVVVDEDNEVTKALKNEKAKKSKKNK